MNSSWKYCIVFALGATVAADISPNYIVLRLLNSVRGILSDGISQALCLLSTKNKSHLVATWWYSPCRDPIHEEQWVVENKRRAWKMFDFIKIQHPVSSINISSPFIWGSTRRRKPDMQISLDTAVVFKWSFSDFHLDKMRCKNDEL